MSTTTTTTGGSTYDAPIIMTNSLTIGSATVTGISSDPTNGSTSNLTTAAALSQAVGTMTAFVNTSIQNFLTGMGGEVVITQSLVDPGFATTAVSSTLGWLITNWTVASGVASISNSASFTTNALAVPAGRYPNAGYYLLSFTVTAITGTLQIVLNGTVLDSITALGSYQYIVNITNALTDNLSFVALNVPSGSTLSLTTPSLNGLSEDLYNFVESMIIQIGGGVTLTEVNTSINDAMAAHLAATNPHKITVALIGAAPAIHYHPQYALITDIPSLAPTTPFLPNKVLTSMPAYVPDIVAGGADLYLSTTLKNAALFHNSASNYDITSGYLMSTIAPATGVLIDAIPSLVGTSATPTAVFTLNPTGATILTLTYRLARPRAVSSVTVYSQNNTGSNPVLYNITNANVTVGTTTNAVVIPAATGMSSIATTFADVVTDTIVVTATGFSNTTNGLYDFTMGFSATFSDVGTTTGAKMAISSDTVVSLNYNANITSLAAGADLSVNTTAVVSGHNYYVALRTDDGTTPIAELFATPPNLDMNQQTYVYALSEMAGTPDPYYGAVTVTGLSSSALSVYTNSPYYTKTPTSYLAATANTVTIAHAFNYDQILDHIQILLPNTLASGYDYPSTATLVLNTTSGSQTIPLTINLSDTSIVNATSAGSNAIVATLGLAVESGSLLSYGSISGYTLTLATSSGSTLLALNSVNVGISCISYDNTNNTWSDGVARTFIGSFQSNSAGFYTVSPMPVGEECRVPLNNFNPTTFYSSYAVSNPFICRDVKASLISAVGGLSDARVASPAGIGVHRDQIDYLTYDSGIYMAQIRKTI